MIAGPLQATSVSVAGSVKLANASPQKSGFCKVTEFGAAARRGAFYCKLITRPTIWVLMYSGFPVSNTYFYQKKEVFLWVYTPLMSPQANSS